MRTGSGRAAGVVGAAVVATLLVSTHPPSGRADTGKTVATERSTRLLWQPCPENQQVDCAALRVPIDWSRPAGESIDLPVARRKATNPSTRIGVLFAAPGGPGAPATDVIIQESQPYTFSPELMARFDVISFDLRGLGKSNPLVCDPELHQQATEEMARFTTERDQQHLDALEAANTTLAADCRERTGPVADHIDNKDVARDLDALRAALGEDTINFYSVSYGTLLGQMYAELFPLRIRTMVLDSVVDHNLNARQLLLGSARAAQHAFDQFADWCAEEPTCVLHGQNVGTILADLYARAEQGTLEVPGDPPRNITSLELNGDLVRMLGAPDWAAVAETLNYLSNPETNASGVPAAPPDHTGTTLAGTTPHPKAMVCADFRSELDTVTELNQVWRQMETVAPDMRFNFVWWEQPQLRCTGWTGVTTNPQHRLQVRAAPPILMINAQDDVATPYEFAASVADQIENSVLVGYDGSGHVVYDSGSECIRNAVDRYLIDRQSPPSGTQCPALPPR